MFKNVLQFSKLKIIGRYGRKDIWRSWKKPPKTILLMPQGMLKGISWVL